MTGARWRLVSETGDSGPQVSSVVLSEDEAREQLAGEAFLHSLAGWAVTPGDNVIVCRGVVGSIAGVTRVVRAVEFDAMADHPGLAT